MFERRSFQTEHTSMADTRSTRRRRFKRSAAKKRPADRRLAVEACEAREMLTTFTVVSELDTGAVGELRWAVTQANTTAGADNIVFNDNVQNINLTMGELAITDAVTINSPATAPNQISINASVNSRVFRVDDSNPGTSLTVVMSGLTLSQGNVTALNSQGGAILNAEDLTLRGCRILSNKANAGGGIANLGNLTTANCRIGDNIADAVGGGGIWNGPGATALIEGGFVEGNTSATGLGGGVLNIGGTLTMASGVRVVGNSATAGGGGIATIGGGTADIGMASIVSNGSDFGGGILAQGQGSEVFTSMNALIENNQALHGGGIAVTDHATGSIRNTFISFNSAGGDGGGIHVSQWAAVSLETTELTNNQAGAFGLNVARGAGMFAEDGVLLQIDSSTISGNGAFPSGTLVTAGGGIFAGDEVVLNVTNSRISGNEARNGAGIYARPRADFYPANALRTEVYVGDSVMDSNAATRAGGAVFAGPFVTLELKCVTITGNSSGTAGGGVRLSGATGTREVLAQVVDSNISHNTSTGVGGGIASLGGVNLSVTNSVVANNRAEERGGGLHLLGNNSTADEANRTTIELSLISGNSAANPNGATVPDQSGGGAWVGRNTSVNINTTTIANNQSRASGGGLAVNETQSFLLRNSTVSGNESGNGAGLSVFDSRATMLQSTFYGNTARLNGGGIHIQASDLNVNHSTVSLNSAALAGVGRGGGIFLDRIRCRAESLETGSHRGLDQSRTPAGRI